MKKWFFVLAALAAIIIVGQIIQEKEQGITPRSNTDFFMDRNDGVEQMTFDPGQVHSGLLLLINGDYPLAKKGTAQDLVTMTAV